MPSTLTNPAAGEVLRTEADSIFWESRRGAVAVGAILALLTVLLYLPILHNDFINFDDPNYVTNNDHVRPGLTWTNVKWAFTHVYEANWYPLTWISHMIDIQMFGLSPKGHHLDSICWHALNVVLLFLVLRFATGYVFRSAVVASLFAALPLNVEAVAWVAERKTVLSTAFLFFALLTYGWYVRRPGIGRYLAVITLFAFGLMAKPMLVTFPFLLLLADYWPLGRFNPADPAQGEAPARGTKIRTLVMEKVPLLVMSAVSSLITIVAARAGGAFSSFVLRPLSLRVQNALCSYVTYLRKGLWPSRLAILYPFPEKPPANWKVALAVVVLLAITTIVWRYRSRRYLLVGWLWFVGTLVPVIGIAQTGPQALADRYAYTSFLGLFVITAWGTADVVRRFRASRAIPALLAMAAITVYAVVAKVQMSYWKDSVSVFSHAIEVTQRNGIAEENLGVALLDKGQPQSAMPHLQKAIEYMPEFSTPHFNLATVLQSQRQFEPAIQQYCQAIQFTGNAKEASNAHNNMGSIRLAQNQPAEALNEFNVAVKDDPTNVFAFMNRGLLEYSRGDLTSSRDDFARAAQLQPSADAYFFLGRSLEAMGNFGSAAKAYEIALKTAPGFRDASDRLQAVRQKIRQ